VPNRPLSALLATIAVASFGPAANAQASTQAAAQAKPAAPAAPTPKPIARAAIVQELNANYKVMDTDGDGGITSAEISAAQTRANQAAAAQYAKRRDAIFQKLDTNKDGQLSLAEFNAGSPMPPARRQAPAQVLAEVDSNKDQKVTIAEFTAPTLTKFDRVDLNHDGIFSVDEQQKTRAPK